MSVVKRISLLCALLCAAGAAHAINLGAIELESALNQPLRATVPLRGVEGDALSGLRVRLAPAERFEAAGLIRHDYLRNLRLSVEERENAQPVVRIRGEGPLREPMLDLLIELRQGRQNVQRGYTLLVDPPEMAREPVSSTPPESARRAPEAEASPEPEPQREPEPATGTESSAAADPEAASTPSSGADSQSEPEAASEASASAGSGDESPRFFEEREAASERQLDPELLAEIEAGLDRPQPRANRSTTPPRPSRRAEDGVYEVRAGETLWRVAYNTRGDNRDITMAQQMLAVVIANPEAFDGGDATALLRGSRLRIPSADTVRRIDAAEAETTMAALTGGERRTDAVDAGLMRSEEEADSVDSSPSPAASDDPAESAPETDDVQGDSDAAADAEDVDGRDDEAEEAEADPDAAALLVDRELTQAQRRAEGAAAAEDPEVDPAPEQAQDDASDPAAGAESSPEPAADDGDDSDSDEGGAAPTDAPSPAPAPAGIAGYDPRLLAAVAAVVLLLLALLVWRRRRAAAEADAADEEYADDAAPATFEISDDMVGADDEAAPEPGDAPRDAGAKVAEPSDASAAGEGDDPMADADFRIAYGMFDDAEARLLEAIRREPERADLRLKLAEVHHAAEQREAFLEAADAASGCGLDDAQRRELARMADRIAPDSRHASGVAAGAAMGASLAAESEAPAAAEPAASEPASAEGVPGVAASAPEQGLDLDLSGLDTEAGSAADDADSADSGGLDFDLDQLDDLQSEGVKESVAPTLDEGAADNLLDFDLDALESGDAASAELPEAPATPAEDENSLDFDLDALDFDTEDGVAADDGAASEPPRDGDSLALPEDDGGLAEPAPSPDAESPDLDLDDFSLADFDASGEAESSDTEPAPATAPTAESTAESGDDDFAIGGLELEPEGEPAADDGGAMAGQLDMARAYVDLGDTELARPMLQEVAERGDAEQQRQAAELLDKLG